MAESRALGELVTAGRTGLGAILGKTRSLGFGEYRREKYQSERG